MVAMSVGDILREQTFTENCNRQLLLHRAAKRKNQTLEKVFFNRQLVFHTEMSDYGSSRQPVEEKRGEIYRLEELHNPKDRMQRYIHTAEMHEQDLCHKNKTNQLKAEMALQTFSHKAEIRRQVSRRIEAINFVSIKLIASIWRENCENCEKPKARWAAQEGDEKEGVAADRGDAGAGWLAPGADGVAERRTQGGDVESHFSVRSRDCEAQGRDQTTPALQSLYLYFNHFYPHFCRVGHYLRLICQLFP